ncbi:MAG: hypothetical protein FWF41_06300 [Betaproteobacteria bacterium]|nr:hypothetical protein [Betaproteobacteria bacterium]
MSGTFDPNEPFETPAQPGVTCWREKEFLVMRQDVAFPKHCCPKCGKPVSSPPRSYNLYWHPRRWIGVIGKGMLFLSFAPTLLMLLFWKWPPPSFLLFSTMAVTVAFIFAQFATNKFFAHCFKTRILFCAYHQRLRQIYALLLRGLPFLLLTLMWIIFVFLSGLSWGIPVLLGIGWVFAFLPDFFPAFSIKKIDKDFVWIKGGGEAFLASLPSSPTTPIGDSAADAPLSTR